MSESLNRYNIRVYGIWINEQNEVLLSHEHRFGKEMVKFPGGGHEFGEGLTETISREIREELGCSVEVGELFYVNEFAQVSAFNSKDQLISFYYLIQGKNEQSTSFSKEKAQLPFEGEHVFWKSIKQLTPADMTFPIDKVVAQKLVELV